MNTSASVNFTKSQKAITKYLQNYAEVEIESMPEFSQQYQHCLIIPAYNETVEFLKTLIQEFQDKQLLIILVINRPDNGSLEANQPLLLWLQQNLETESTTENQILYKLSNQSSALVIDRDSKPIAKQFGVGLARKIAADCATALIHRGVIKSPWIGSTDADTVLPKAYFETFSLQADSGNSNNRETAALCLPFRHRNSEQKNSLPQDAKVRANIHHLTQVYEAKLHHYVLALRWIGSPYAFHTIGSCLAFHYQHYAQARGFPKRSAGEDFYLLNKLAKLGKVHTPSEPVLSIQSRVSDRVPFGTGPAVQKLLEESASGNNWLKANLFYNPELFIIIKAINNHAKEFLSIATDEPETITLSAQQQRVKKDLQRQLNLLQQLTKIRQQFTTPTQRQQAFNNYFDAFRTMKAVHFLRDHGYPNVPFSKVINAPYLSPIPSRTHQIAGTTVTDNASVQAHLNSLIGQVWHSGN